jgi:hypothetical protein
MKLNKTITRRSALRGAALRMLALAALVALLAPPSHVAHADSATRLRIGVTRDGITRLTPADFQAAGVDPASVDPRSFSMTSLGVAVAIEVTGEADGRFDPGDQVLFFGEKFRGPEMDQKYTDERVYWLEMGGVAGPRIATVDAQPTGSDTAPPDVLTTVRAEQNTIWWTLHTLGLDTQDTWFWGRLQTGGSPGDSLHRDFSYIVPDPAPGSAATLRVEEISRYNSNSSNFYHRTTLAVNGAAVGTFDWQGRVRIVHAAPVPEGILAGNTTTVTVGAVNRVDKGTVSDDIYVNYWELDYRRRFRAWQGQMDFRAESAGTREYVVDGWSDPAVEVWDVTVATAPRRLVNAALSLSGAEYQLRFRVAESPGQRYWLQEASDCQSPASVRRRDETGLRTPPGGADVVIVAHADLRAAAEGLADWHRDHGRRALVADARDVYDEFNQGVYHPKAVPAMLKWARAHWTPPGPVYLVLLGDGHWNFKGYNTPVYPAPPIMIPPYLAWVDPWQGEVPADLLFGELSGDAVPEVAVGRLLANTLDEAWTIVNKITRYDESTRAAGWQRRALFVADNNDGVDFSGASDLVIDSYLPPDMAAERVYLGVTHTDAAGARAAIRDAINAGALIVQYAGHGATWRWAGEQIWTTHDVPGLTNGGMLPVVMTFNCLDGYFAHTDPGQQSIAEVMQRWPAGGAVAAISPSGLGVVYDQQNFRSILMDVIFNQGIRETGVALQRAKQQFYWRYGSNYLLYTLSLYGDPALMLPGAEAAAPVSPQLDIAPSGSSAWLTWAAVTEDIFGQPTSTTGYAIWRGVQPYFQPDQPGCACEQVTETTALEWWDEHRIGDASTNHYWIAHAINAAGTSANSNGVGEFDFALTPAE